MSRLSASGGQSIGALASTSAFLVNIQDWFPLGWTDAESEAPILWSPDVKSQLIGKDPDAGRD